LRDHHRLAGDQHACDERPHARHGATQEDERVIAVRVPEEERIALAADRLEQREGRRRAAPGGAPPGMVVRHHLFQPAAGAER